MEKIEFIVSEWGFHTEFNDFDDAIKYCVANNLLCAQDGLLWIQSVDRDALEEFMKRDDVDHTYMRFKHEGKLNNWTWCVVFEEWEDSTEAEKEGEEDFQEKSEERKKYIEDKYGKDHGKTPAK